MQCTKEGPYTVYRQFRPKSACAFAQADLDLSCLLTESMDTVVYVYEQRMPRLDIMAGPSLFTYDIGAHFPVLCIISVLG